MRSKKSIFYKGFVFVASLFAMMFLGQTRVEAANACQVGFSKENKYEGQYLTLGGSNYTWTDQGLVAIDCDSGIKPELNKVLVNGKVNEIPQGHSSPAKPKLFIPNDFNPGHYTIEYKYTLNGAQGSIFRYVRILEPSFDTSNNYTLGAFNSFYSKTPQARVDAEIVNSFYYSKTTSIINFVKEYGQDSSIKTYVVITNLSGKEIKDKTLIQISSQDFAIENVIKENNDYYLVGNLANGKGGFIKVTIGNGRENKAEEITVVASNLILASKEGSVYNNLYKKGNDIYLVGKNSLNKPLIDKVDISGSLINIEQFYLNDKEGITGEYFDIVLNGANLYAVGAYSKDYVSSSATNGLYTSLSQTAPVNAKDLSNIIEEKYNSSFNRILVSSESTNLIIGETNAIEIMGKGHTILATNNKSGYYDALILEVEKTATEITYAEMLGTTSNDKFTNISSIKGNKYFISGTSNNDSQTLNYILDLSKPEGDKERLVEDATSRQSKFVVNGAVNLNLNDTFVYYGKIAVSEPVNVMGVYYPHASLENAKNSIDPLLLTLDARKYKNEAKEDLNNENIFLTVNAHPSSEESEYYNCHHYVIYFNNKDNLSKESGVIDASRAGVSTKLTYEIDNLYGGKILIERTVEIVEKQKPINLVNSNTGILKWYVYDRLEKYDDIPGTRLDLDKNSQLVDIKYGDGKKTVTVSYEPNYSYYFSGTNNSKKVNDMIKAYFLTENLEGFRFNDDKLVSGSLKNQTFIHSSQFKAAFSTVEVARRFAYYQEFSRVVKVKSTSLSPLGVKITPESLGAQAYLGEENSINDGDFYIYYIDLIGDDGEGLSYSTCRISDGKVKGNCALKGGFAFGSLESVANKIMSVVQYNNYFVRTKNTIYNGSIDPVKSINESEELDIPREYIQKMTTKNYTNYLGLEKNSSNKMRIDALYLNVMDLNKRTTQSGETLYEAGTILYQEKGKNVYFGGKVENAGTPDKKNIVGLGNKQTLTNLSIKTLQVGDQVTKTEEVYYYNETNVVFSYNTCYKIFYSSDKLDPKITEEEINLGIQNGTIGAYKEFCLDTKGPNIIYHKENSDLGDNESFSPGDNKGSTIKSPAYISSDFKVLRIEDLDDYAYVAVNGQVYPNKCGEDAEKSESCLKDIEKFIRKTYRYSKENKDKTNWIEFRDRTGNVTRFYFVIGTIPPAISKTEVSEEVNINGSTQSVVTSFTLHINFYETNLIGDFLLNSVTSKCADSWCGGNISELDNDIISGNGTIKSEGALQFEKDVTHYIYAINTTIAKKEIDSIITLRPNEEGLYINDEFDGITYKIENEYFVEYRYPDAIKSLIENIEYSIKDSYGTEIKVSLPNNYFVKNDVLYAYEDNAIQAKNIKIEYNKVDSEIDPEVFKNTYNNYYIYSNNKYVANKNEIYNPEITYYIRNDTYENNPNIEKITLNSDNEFKFIDSDSQRVYKIVVEGNHNYLMALPKRYLIEDNQIRINYPNKGKVIYELDPLTHIITFINPDAISAKKVDITFTRSKLNLETQKVSIGVSVPKTEPVYNIEGRPDSGIKIDKETGIDTYRLVEGKQNDYRIVDGIYNFSITQKEQGFGYIPSVEATMYLTKLDLKVGYEADGKEPRIIKPISLSPYKLEDNMESKVLIFDNKAEIGQVVHAERYNQQFLYPLADSSITGIGAYGNTYFSRGSGFVQYQSSDFTVFQVIVYDTKSYYGVPPENTTNKCNQIVIYGPGFANVENLPKINGTPSCGEGRQLVIKSNQMDVSQVKSELAKYGIYKPVGDYSFILSGENLFYSLYLTEFKENDQGSFVSNNVVLREDIYIDGSFDDETIKGQVGTSHSAIDPLYKFTKEKDIWTLKKSLGPDSLENSILGGTKSLFFNIDYYKPNISNNSQQNKKENKLLYFDLQVNGKKYMCNVAQVISNTDKSIKCSDGYVDNGLSVFNDDLGEYYLAFSKSGDYKITFYDASRNYKSYQFTIDKTAPEITLAGVSDLNSTPHEVQLVEEGKYIVKGYTKNPEFTFVIIDKLTKINSYKYTFSYLENVVLDSQEVAAFDPNGDNTYKFKMSEPAVNTLENKKFDGKVTLKITANDALDNTTLTPITIDFWVDYLRPNLSESPDNKNLNRDYIDPENISNLRDKTITVLSKDYVNKNIEYDPNNEFAFIDPGVNVGNKKYVFKLRAEDIHNIGGQFPEDFPDQFPNTIMMKFYKAEKNDSGFSHTTIEGTTEEFEFGIPTINGGARWIYITVMDSVGNEAENGIYLPIIVEDSEIPKVVENGIRRCDTSSSGECLNPQVITPHNYKIPGEQEDSLVYSSNGNIEVEFSEYIQDVVECSVQLFSMGENGLEGPQTLVCEEFIKPEEKTPLPGEKIPLFKYLDKKFKFMFVNKTAYEGKTAVIRFVVSDFAEHKSTDPDEQGHVQKQFTLVIDNIKPTIELKDDKKVDTLEYAVTNNDRYNQNYKYLDDLTIIEDQDPNSNDIEIENIIYRYAPTFTYKNYEMYEKNKFRAVKDGLIKQHNKKYYLKLDIRNIYDKKCVYKAGDNLCFVEDVPNTYYFNELLNENEFNGKQVWTTMSLGGNNQSIKELNQNTKIGVYKISYRIKDYAGNSSDIKYKLVFVSDTRAPTIDIYDINSELKYKDITSENPNKFTGKLNTSAKFVGSDYPSKIAYESKVLFYKCPLNSNRECIDSDYLFRENKQYIGNYNSNLITGGEDISGVYKAIVYDNGQYVGQPNTVIGIDETEHTKITAEVYILTKNMASSSFAINKSKVGSSYTVNGNRYDNHEDGNIKYVYNENGNSLEITGDEKNAGDIKLVQVDNNLPKNERVKDISRTNAIGFYDDIEKVESAGNTITLIYKDAKKRPVYEEVFEKAKVLNNEFAIDKSYYHINETIKGDTKFYSVLLCNINVSSMEPNPCAEEPDKTYVSKAVKAIIYEDGEYSGLGLMNNYGTISPIIHKFTLDNKPYEDNKNMFKPTGINYWYSVPRKVVSSSQEAKTYFSQVIEDKYEPVLITRDEPSDWKDNNGKYYIRISDNNYVLKTDQKWEDVKTSVYTKSKEVAKNVDVYEERYLGNLNSDYFYAFASETQAKEYLATIYKEDILAKQELGAYPFIDIYGQRDDQDGNADEVYRKISSRVNDFIIKTFTKDKKFNTDNIKQIEYKEDESGNGSGISDKENRPGMYQSTYLLKIKKPPKPHRYEHKDYEVEYTYKIVEKGYTPQEGEELIKVNLNIISSNENTVKINQYLDIYKPEEKEQNRINSTSCVVDGLGNSDNVYHPYTDGYCDSITFRNNSSATIIYIDEDINRNRDQGRGQINTTYFGIMVYSQGAKVSYNENGDWIPLDDIKKYDDNHQLDVNGDNIWLDNKWVKFSEIKNTNLYTKDSRVCSNVKGCVFVTYAPLYDREERPSINNAELIYDYKEGKFVSKSSLTGLKYTYNQDGTMCDMRSSCNFIPVKTLSKIRSYQLGNNDISMTTNKKTYLELFNTSKEVSKLFELVTVIKGGEFDEYKSYATLQIRNLNDSEFKYYNINDFIKITTDGYTKLDKEPSDFEISPSRYYVKEGGLYVPVSQGSKWDNSKEYYINQVLECIIDIPLESKLDIIITDSANNKVQFNVSHTNKIPTINYQKQSAETDSDVSIEIKSESKIENISPNRVKVEKLDENGQYQEASPQCYLAPENSNNNILNFIFNYKEELDCSGVYKVTIKDNYGNSSFKEFIFNPHKVKDTIKVESFDGKENISYKSEKNLIVNNYFYFEANSKLSYINLYKYPAYSNDKLESSTFKSVSIRDFESRNIKIDGCPVFIESVSFDIYRIRVEMSPDGSCDGVYKVEVVNSFSDKLADSSYSQYKDLVNLEGNNEMILITGPQAPDDWNINYTDYFSKDNLGNYIRLTSSTPYEENKFYTQKVISEYMSYLETGVQSVEIDSIAPNGEFNEGGELQQQNFNINIDGVPSLDATKTIMTSPLNKVKFENKFVKVIWGMQESYSLTTLKYQETTSPTPILSESKEGVEYTIPFEAQMEFAPVEKGLHVYEFYFEDAVGNKSDTYTIEINVVPPAVGFFDVKLDSLGNPEREPVTGAIKVKEMYEYGERIPTQTILKCIFAGNDYRNCELDNESMPYNYKMLVNNNDYSDQFNDPFSISEIINKKSAFLLRGEDKLKDELYINLTVSIKGKNAIKTELFVIIDQKAPEITIDATPVNNTSKFKGTVTVSLDNKDTSNVAKVFKCDKNPEDDINKQCFVKSGDDYILNNDPIGSMKADLPFIFDERYSGYFLVVATDGLGNESRKSFTLDNEAPIVKIYTDNGSIAPNMYTNASSVKVEIYDELTFDSRKNRLEVAFKALNEEDKVLEEKMDYDAYLGFTKEGKYTVTPIDEVGIRGSSVSFYIYRKTPKFEVIGGTNLVKKDISISWKVSEDELIAPIVNATVDGAMYNATYNKESNKFIGEVITSVGQHTFVLIDAAGNRAVLMATISNTNKVCINGNLVDVKMQAYYSVDNLLIGNEEGVKYDKNDVIIFALPSQTTGTECTKAGALGYRTLDESKSFFWVKNDKNANSLNNNSYDFVKNGYISKNAIDEVNKIGGTVVVFAVDISTANDKLGYKIGTNFFVEDPLGWSMIFVSAMLCLFPIYRIFVKKKVRVI